MARYSKPAAKPTDIVTAPRSEPSAAETLIDERTLTISLGHILGALLMVAIIVSGFSIGRRVPGSPGLSTPQPTAVAVAPALQITSSGAGTQSGNSNREIAPGQVINLGAPNHPLIGQAAIEVEGTLLDGTRVKVSDYLGHPLMINFWASWCPPCRIEMPWMEAAYEKYQPEGFVLLAINAGERVAPSMAPLVIRSFVDSMGLTFPVMLADDTYVAQEQYQVYGLPSTFLVNRDGKVVDALRGMFPNDATFEARLQKILAPAAESQ